MRDPSSEVQTAVSPVTPVSAAQYGSDVIVDILRELKIPYAALNPGASFRGLHDSLVNYGEGQPPEIVLCCHEEIAVAMAHGYARVTGRPMAAALHNVVGLQHATMAIFNAWCDQVPVLLLGGTGPMDSEKRRPWIDWVHTALVQGNQIRDYVKWDDQPASVEAIPESLLRAYRIAMMEPRGPVYVCFDSTLQEQELVSPVAIPDPERFSPPSPPAPAPDTLTRLASLLAEARWPVILADNTGRHPEALPALLELAELLACPVVDLGGRFNFPGGHPLDLTACREEALREADLVLALDVYDLASALSSSMLRERTGAHLAVPTDAKIAHITLGDFLYSSWVTDVQKLLPVDLPIAGDSALALPELVRLCQIEMRAGPVSLDRIEERRQRVQELHENASARFREATQQAWPARPMSALRVYGELWELIREEDWALVNGQYGAIRQSWDFREPAQFAGSPRGAGLGYALGASLGGALAHKGSGRICIDIQGDGDFLYTPSALWTAVNCQIPLLIVLLNNRSYGNDERHQEHMAITRGRPVENKGVGIHLTSPETDFATLARSFQVAGFGPIEDPEALRPVLAEAIKVVKSGRPALVDVVTRLG